LQCVAVCCSVVQCGAVCCTVLQCVAVYCIALDDDTNEEDEVCCSALHCGAVCCSVVQCVALCCSVLQCVAVCCSVLHCVGWRYEPGGRSVLQCVALWCSVLQFAIVGWRFSRNPHCQNKLCISMRFSQWFTNHCESPWVNRESLWKSWWSKKNCTSVWDSRDLLLGFLRNAVICSSWIEMRFLRDHDRRNELWISMRFSSWFTVQCKSPWVHCDSMGILLSSSRIEIRFSWNAAVWFVFVKISMRFSWWFQIIVNYDEFVMNQWASFYMLIVNHNAMFVDSWCSIFFCSNQYEILMMIRVSLWITMSSL